MLRCGLFGPIDGGCAPVRALRLCSTGLTKKGVGLPYPTAVGSLRNQNRIGTALPRRNKPRKGFTTGGAGMGCRGLMGLITPDSCYQRQPSYVQYSLLVCSLLLASYFPHRRGKEDLWKTITKSPASMLGISCCL